MFGIRTKTEAMWLEKNNPAQPTNLVGISEVCVSGRLLLPRLGNIRKRSDEFEKRLLALVEKGHQEI